MELSIGRYYRIPEKLQKIEVFILHGVVILDPELGKTYPFSHFYHHQLYK